MGNGQVQIAYLHRTEVSHSWADSMRRLIEHDTVHAQRLAGGGKPLSIYCSTGQIVVSRNYVAKLFLDSTQAEWLFFIDTDMGFEPDTVDRLVEAADPVERPVVGGLAFAVVFAGMDAMGGLRQRLVPTLYRFGKRDSDGKHSFAEFAEYPPDQLVRVAATGAACLLLHRSALEKLREAYGDKWFDQVVADSGKTVGEDFSLCLRLGAQHIPVHVHTGIKTTHHKDFWISEDDYFDQQVVRATSDPDHSYLPPATDEVAVLVPVMGRPQHAEPFMRSLRASTGLATAYALAYDEDTEAIEAWDKAGATVIPNGHMTFAEKVNTGYRQTGEPWLFLTGSDVRFHPGWLDAAQNVAAATGARVVGTNDLGSQRVQSGEHATHMLISRTYVDLLGASWDGPKVVAHEGYKHWYVDDEIVTVAKQREVFAAATDAIVEHLHPLFGKAESDDVYRLGWSHSATDKALWEQRQELYADAQ